MFVLSPGYVFDLYFPELIESRKDPVQIRLSASINKTVKTENIHVKDGRVKRNKTV